MKKYNINTNNSFCTQFIKLSKTNLDKTVIDHNVLYEVINSELSKAGQQLAANMILLM